MGLARLKMTEIITALMNLVLIFKLLCDVVLQFGSILTCCQKSNWTHHISLEICLNSCIQTWLKFHIILYWIFVINNMAFNGWSFKLIWNPSSINKICESVSLSLSIYNNFQCCHKNRNSIKNMYREVHAACWPLHRRGVYLTLGYALSYSKVPSVKQLCYIYGLAILCFIELSFLQ